MDFLRSARKDRTGGGSSHWIKNQRRRNWGVPSRVFGAGGRRRCQYFEISCSSPRAHLYPPAGRGRPRLRGRVRGPLHSPNPLKKPLTRPTPRTREEGEEPPSARDGDRESHVRVVRAAAALGGTQVMLWFGSLMSQVLQWTQFCALMTYRVPPSSTHSVTAAGQ